MVWLCSLSRIEKDPSNREVKLRDLLRKNEKLKESLLEIEMQTVGEIEVSFSPSKWYCYSID